MANVISALRLSVHLTHGARRAAFPRVGHRGARASQWRGARRVASRPYPRARSRVDHLLAAYDNAEKALNDGLRMRDGVADPRRSLSWLDA